MKKSEKTKTDTRLINKEQNNRLLEKELNQLKITVNHKRETNLKKFNRQLNSGSTHKNNNYIQKSTLNLLKTFKQIDKNFKYKSLFNPKRTLTKPSEQSEENSCDNVELNYIMHVNDVLLDENNNNKYVIMDKIGEGTFGQVAKCKHLNSNKIVAIKIVKNNEAYFEQSIMEITILELLNNEYVNNETNNSILKIENSFVYKKHVCIVFELLSVNLYDLIKQNKFNGLSTKLIKVFAIQLLDTLTILNEANIIHCDLKPENILLEDLESPNIKVIDFGSACHEQQIVFSYIQSRFYRSPEVILGMEYTKSIDVWSLGCILAELFIGLPLFPGSSEYNQLCRITEMFGHPPNFMLDIGNSTKIYYNTIDRTYKLKNIDQFNLEYNLNELPSKRYFPNIPFRDLIFSYNFPNDQQNTQKEILKEYYNREVFCDFVMGLLKINPIERWTAQEAKSHPFITGEKYSGNYKPKQTTKRPTTNTDRRRFYNNRQRSNTVSLMSSIDDSKGHSTISTRQIEKMLETNTIRLKKAYNNEG